MRHSPQPSDEVHSPLERPTSPGLVDSKDLVVREGRIVSATLVQCLMSACLTLRMLWLRDFSQAPNLLPTSSSPLHSSSPIGIALSMSNDSLFMPPASLMAKLSEVLCPLALTHQRGKSVITPDAAANIVARFAKQLSLVSLGWLTAGSGPAPSPTTSATSV